MLIFLDIVASIIILWMVGALHLIDEGHIGVYRRGGAILKSWS
jgi:hypothetical protein